MKKLIIFFLLLNPVIAFSADTVYYTTSGNEVIASIPDWIQQNNPKCTEYGKIYDSTYYKLASDGLTCWRYRTWYCADTKLKGVDVEPLPISFCEVKK